MDPKAHMLEHLGPSWWNSLGRIRRAEVYQRCWGMRGDDRLSSIWHLLNLMSVWFRRDHVCRLPLCLWAQPRGSFKSGFSFVTLLSWLSYNLFIFTLYALVLCLHRCRCESVRSLGNGLTDSPCLTAWIILAFLLIVYVMPWPYILPRWLCSSWPSSLQGSLV
jgi:hypothetical protein